MSCHDIGQLIRIHGCCYASLVTQSAEYSINTGTSYQPYEICLDSLFSLGSDAITSNAYNCFYCTTTNATPTLGNRTRYVAPHETSHSRRYSRLLWNNPPTHYRALSSQPTKHHNAAKYSRHDCFPLMLLLHSAEQANPASRQNSLSLQVFKPRCARRLRSDTIVDVLVCTLVAKLRGPATA